MTRALTRLAKPFPEAFILDNPNGYGQYVKHSVVVEKLLAVVGPYSFRIDELITNADGTVEGCLATLTVTIDDQTVSITEIGDCETPSNWKTNGARAKDAASDAIKRCAMRIGVGLHLWSQQQFTLADQLAKQDTDAEQRPYINTPGDLDQHLPDPAEQLDEARRRRPHHLAAGHA